MVWIQGGWPFCGSDKIWISQHLLESMTPPPTPPDGHTGEVGWMPQHLLENMTPPPMDKRLGGGLCTAVALALLLGINNSWRWASSSRCRAPLPQHLPSNHTWKYCGFKSQNSHQIIDLGGTGVAFSGGLQSKRRISYNGFFCQLKAQQWGDGACQHAKNKEQRIVWWALSTNWHHHVTFCFCTKMKPCQI